jgi:hypothetical protein
MMDMREPFRAVCETIHVREGEDAGAAPQLQ